MFINPITINNNSTNTAPTINDDVNLGYSLGSLWYNTSTNTWYVCSSNASGNAAWTEFYNGVNASITRRIGYPYYEDFVSDINGNELKVSNVSSGNGSVNSASDVPSAFHSGIRILRTGSSNSRVSRSQDFQNVGAAILLNDEVTESVFKVKLPGQATNLATNTYSVIIGWSNENALLPTNGIYFHYNPTTYAGATQHYFRAVFKRGANTFVKQTNILMPVTATYQTFTLTSYAGSNYVGNRYLSFKCQDDGSSTIISETITETEISNASITPPYQNTDYFGFTVGINKPNGISTQRTMYFDFVSLDKRNI